jgi:hypothetical protein
VVAKVEFHFGELFSRVGFIVTSLETDSRAVVRFHNKRGRTCRIHTGLRGCSSRRPGHDLGRPKTRSRPARRLSLVSLCGCKPEPRLAELFRLIANHAW